MGKTMQRRVSMLAVVAALLCSSLAHAAPWSFDPERFLASLSDEARCIVGMGEGPEITGSVVSAPAEDSEDLSDISEDR